MVSHLVAAVYNTSSSSKDAERNPRSSEIFVKSRENAARRGVGRARSYHGNTMSFLCISDSGVQRVDVASGLEEPKNGLRAEHDIT